ncbi:MAG TPA: metal-dependent transcriptional regulator [Candidatus Omnitrophota bacterium]|jgi:DtxR family Mn-dependent transcriptional regulator|nr:metal-dependent transcriptional regulator [Candidatus Omnitrophota bacterium]
MFPLTRSRQDYLKALYALSLGGEPVATSRLARRLNVSAPSVTNMLARLASERLVDYAPRAGASLTSRGRREALDIVRRHRILETFLVRVLGLDWSEVHEDAEVLEHHVSDRVLLAIDRLIGHPEEDPHGHPIPDRRGRISRRTLVPLSTVAQGKEVRVREIRDSDAGRLARWKELGLVPGARVKVRDVRAVDGVTELEVAGRPVVVGQAALEGVLVQSTRRTLRGA